MQLSPLSTFLSEKPRNGLYKSKEYQKEAGNRWVKMNELYSLNFLGKEATAEHLVVNESELERFSCVEGDLLFGRTSLTLEGVGDCLLVGEIDDQPVFESNLFRLRFDLDKAYPLFFYYFFKAPNGRQIIQRIAKQTAATSITAAELIQEDVPYLPLDVQKLIANKTHLLDQKITLNRQINQTLEQMAQTLFKSWFVDFDPVMDNALDAGNPIPDELQHRAEARQAVRESEGFKPLPDEVRQLFPDAFEESELGWVPKGWDVGCLANIASYTSNRVATTTLSLNNYVSTENMLAEKKGIVEAANLPTVTTVPAYTTGNVLISNIRPYFKKIWMANGDGGHSNDVLGFEVKEQNTEGYLFNLLYQDALFEFMMTTAKGSKMPRGDKKAILDWQLVIPPCELREYFSLRVGDFYVSSSKRTEENKTLTKLRDTLLPKLISGELRLDDIELAVE
ncbi:restriction endonuclease subunit S [Vibrio cholerae]|nr:restriction endonuclease subunit S [Vibrio cholerae]MDV2320949.1 restriction endonuclease subunit S [Vibrio cholerae]